MGVQRDQAIGTGIVERADQFAHPHLLEAETALRQNFGQNHVAGRRALTVRTADDEFRFRPAVGRLDTALAVNQPEDADNLRLAAADGAHDAGFVGILGNALEAGQGAVTDRQRLAAAFAFGDQNARWRIIRGPVGEAGVQFTVDVDVGDLDNADGRQFA